MNDSIPSCCNQRSINAPIHGKISHGRLADKIDSHLGLIRGFYATTLWKAFFLLAFLSAISTGLAVEIRLRLDDSLRDNASYSWLISICIAFATMLIAAWILWWVLGWGWGSLTSFRNGKFYLSNTD